MLYAVLVRKAFEYCLQWFVLLKEFVIFRGGRWDISSKSSEVPCKMGDLYDCKRLSFVL